MKIIVLLILLYVPSIAHCQVNRFDVVIDEIMCDPSPQALQVNGLPEAEFVELKNTSQKTVNLNGWKISDITSTATININFMLLPDSVVVIGSVSTAALLSSFARSIGLSNFPSLDNDGELIFLTSKDGKTIHAVEYSNSWYKNAVKSNGGWTLEMIDPKNPCMGTSNWTACVNPLGGTPGKKNSVDGVNNDATQPNILRSYATDSLSITVLFDEPLDSLSAATVANYSISNGINVPASAISVAPTFDKVTMRLLQPLKRNETYFVTVKKVSDCSGNEIGSVNKTKLGLASPVDSFDVVINEILFNPKPEGIDYIEIYNRSNKVIDLKELYIGNYGSNGSAGSLKQLSVSPLLLFPGEYRVLTENIQLVKRQYVTKDQHAFLELSALPSYPDDKGSVLLLNNMGKFIDAVLYLEKWHFKLIDNYEGVALERIDYNKTSLDPANWHSASTSSGYGTPGYQNSQFKTETIMDATMVVIPEIFSPDNDGYNDFATILYNFPESGYACNISIYDVSGRLVKHLIHNAICGIKGYFRWDGLDDNYKKLPIGVYILTSEVFNLRGKTKKIKTGIVLARKLR